MNGYELSRNWFNFCFDNPELIKPIHSAIFFFAVEHCNRLGGKEKFGFPSQMTMEAIGVKKHQTYSAALNDLEDWGFITFVERSKNQWSANIISLSAVPKKGKARGKALDKATIKHKAKQGHGNGQSTGQSKDSIDKPINQEPINQEQGNRKTPTLKEVTDCISSTLFQKGISKSGFPVEQLAEKFWNNYETKGWQINGQIMAKWQPKVGDWINEHLKDPTRLLGKNHGKLSAEDAEQMDIAIIKHARDVLANDNNTDASEDNRLRRIS